MFGLLLSVKVLTAQPANIQEYAVSYLDTTSGEVRRAISTDKRFVEMERGRCVIIRPLDQGRIYFGGRC